MSINLCASGWYGKNFVEASEKYKLTIKDVLSFKKGQQIKILCMDRNFCDTIGNLRRSITRYVFEGTDSFRPEDIFEPMIYTHDSDLKGQGDWGYYKGEFEFDLEYKTDYWYPLTNGYLPAEDEQKCVAFSWSKPQHYTQFPTSTCLGWRGPMILWTDLPKMPDVKFDIKVRRNPKRKCRKEIDYSKHKY
jgi:hypothetical protein